MYLDPGSTSLFVQGLFAAVATALTLFARSRQWLAGVWARVTQVIKPRRGPEP